MYAFVRNMIGVKSDQAVNSAIEAIVRWDPKSATEAELRTMEQHLDALGRQVAEARMTLDREKREADAIDARIIGDARYQYTLGYLSKAAPGGAYREVEVRVARPDCANYSSPCVRTFAKAGYYPTPPVR